MTAIVVVRGGVAEVETGRAIIVDMDNAAECIEEAEYILELLSGKRGVAHLRKHLHEMWPDLKKRQRGEL